jgi:oligopeptide/dipeptide ABC transporter ATP-binding protein
MHLAATSTDAISQAVLAVRGLSVEFTTQAGAVQVVRDVTIDVQRGETLAIVGESGCGKSTCLQAVMGLLRTPPARIVAGTATLLGEDLIGMAEYQLNAIRGTRVGMIFQDPVSSLNPTMRVGDQIGEALRAHRGVSRRQASERAIDLLARMRISDPAARARQYPFELSGGMAQRVMIAASLACDPDLLIADEPTTGLDVTVQQQVLQLLRDLQRDSGMAIVLITHDLGVVARMAGRVAVMYAGQIVESGTTDEIFYQSSHPYTVALKRALPRSDMSRRSRLAAIDGLPPDLRTPAPGCSFCERCEHAMRLCSLQAPPLIGGTHSARCWLQHPRAPRCTAVWRRPS